MTIGERIKKLRVDLGHTQIEFAKILGVSPQTLNAWENGKANPKADGLEKIKRATNIDWKKLMEGIEEIEVEK